MGLTPLTFTGVSSLSNDLQTVLSRAVSIAQIPLKSLQSADSDAIQKKGLLGGFNDAAAALGNAVTKLGTISAAKALNASSSDTSKVNVQNVGATAAAVYTISDLTSIATAASETTTAGFADSNATPVSSTGSMRLTVGAKQVPITLVKNTLVELRDAINGAGAGVSATILTAGALNYLSVSASTTGATTLTLEDDPQGADRQMLSSTNQGSNAVFKLNGVAIDRTSNTVNDVVPGLSFTLQQPTGLGGRVNLSLATDRSQLSSAISDFVSAYNGMSDKVQEQVGQTAGLLTGDYVVRAAQEDMRALSGYSADGTIKSLWEMGVAFDVNGKLSFDSARFNTLSDSQVQGAMAFFGSTTTGFGALSSKLTALTDPVTGLIKLEQDGLDATDKNLQSQIGTLTDRINALQATTAARLQAADALLAGLESQQKMLSASIQSANFSLYGKQQGN